ncbi:MAG: hypothetical protein O8C61_12850 [Candidatus Methanoperedens sp.]|nr:hypothetical protein [Candidatus Methanoperedens sp.]
MNIFKKYLISIFLIVLLINTAYGFAGMGNLTPIPQDTSTQKPQDLKNATGSDQDLIMAQHLIEFDAMTLKSQNELFIRETLIFRNNGAKDYFGPLKTWVPDGSGNIKVSKSEMMTGGGLIPLDFNKTGNIISWQEYVEKNSTLPLLYAVEYTVAMEPGASSITYSKKLAYPALINYSYTGKPGLPVLVLKITKPQESSIKLFDENRNEITTGVANETGELIRFDSLQFKELNIEITGSSAIPAVKNGYGTYAVYVVIGILILLVLLYPYISKKLKEGNSDKTSKVTSSPNASKSKEEKSKSVSNPVQSEEELKGNSDMEKDPKRKELGLKLKELETKYKSGDLLDEEYEDEKNAIQNKLKSINKRSK